MNSTWIVQFSISTFTTLVLVPICLIGFAVCLRSVRISARLWTVALALLGLAFARLLNLALFAASLAVERHLFGTLYSIRGMQTILTTMSGLLFAIGVALYLLDARRKLSERLPPSVLAANAAQDASGMGVTRNGKDAEG